MDINLSYGKKGLTVQLPTDLTTIVSPEFIPALPDQQGAIKHVLRNPIKKPPLKTSVKPGQKVAISICDVTRPMPNHTVLPIVLSELNHIPEEDITILIATGTHRAVTKSELTSMLGDSILSKKYKIINHDAFDENTLTLVGNTVNGIDVYLNDRWVNSDFRITLGFVEPHFFAGFSGGPKMIAPGLAGFNTIMPLHSSELIQHPESKWGVTYGNPIHDTIREISTMAPADFSVDVTINKNHDITSVYAGNMSEVHHAACQFTKDTAMQKVPHKYDIVITTNSGYPLDMNLYQSVKGMSAAYQIVRPGGIIICASECSDGIPDTGKYKEILQSANTPSKLLEIISHPQHNKHDQWQVQIQAQIQETATIYLKTDYLSKADVQASHLKPVSNITSFINKIVEESITPPTICVLPEGPQTIPYVK